jgi:aspartate racemase
MAQQLEALGQRISLVALFDSYAPGYGRSISEVTSLNYKLSRLLQKIHRHADTLSSLGAKEKLSYVESRLKRVIFKFNMAIGLRSTRSRREFLDAMREAALNYHAHVYPGRVTLFRASRQPAGYDRDLRMGWGALASGGVEIHDIPGEYGSIVFEPNVQMLAEKLQSVIQSQSDGSSQSLPNPSVYRTGTSRGQGFAPHKEVCIAPVLGTIQHRNEEAS